ncbi:hypothetical protein Enr13x_26490 [Stieleria neptunia]|uniref:DUF3311 domain-containing protein n=1 Tax=Stieleria neptunia TaxID=2527979 RepID=A0A518HPN0_9BACT|nr:DUF3311 domain-containing protein [Stieleria neptunia]QDV42799.1 hypothetical protein Enr13x_26490 [Stieleria neptunia]
MKYLVWGLVVLLVVLHQDLWNWDNDRLVFGFLPVTLAYHAGISIAASIVWLMATKFAWPSDLEGVTESAAETDRSEAVS